jgi:hypothetical protein
MSHQLKCLFWRNVLRRYVIYRTSIPNSVDATKDCVWLFSNKLMHNTFGCDNQMWRGKVLLTIVMLHGYGTRRQQSDVVKHMGVALVRVPHIQKLMHLDKHIVNKF